MKSRPRRSSSAPASSSRPRSSSSASRARMKNGTRNGRPPASPGTPIMGIKPENLRFRDHDPDELAHYAKACVDVEYKFPFGSGDWQELEGIANRTDYDLRQHQRGMRSTNDWYENGRRPDEGQAARGTRRLPQGSAVVLRRPEEAALHPLCHRAQRGHGPQHAGVPGRRLRRRRGQGRNPQPAALPSDPGADQSGGLPAGQEGWHARDRPQTSPTI